MSINQFSSDHPAAIWWTTNHHHAIMENHHSSSSSSSLPNSSWSSQLQTHNHDYPQPTPLFPTPNTTFSFNLNRDYTSNNDEDDDETDGQPTADDRDFNFPTIRQAPNEAEVVEKELMFEKPLTPSDVGKLNRLVIPKQHAEKYFPLGGGDSADRGLLLSFEDEEGKSWRFRYSYWNSSQSYVLTKGWSRYVKEKRLEAGDVVFFERHRTDGEKLYIGWRRRSISGSTGQDSSCGVMVAQNAISNGTNSAGGGWTRMFYSAHPYPARNHHHQHQHQHRHPVPYQPDPLHAGSQVQSQAMGAGNSKVLRLFGVNLECQTHDSDPSTSATSSSLSANPPPDQQRFYPAQSFYSSDLPNHADFTFFPDVNQLRNRRG